MFIESVMPSNHLILSHPLLLLPSIFPSIRVFSNESALHSSWSKYWSFSISSVQFSCSVRSNSLQPKDCSTPGLPVHHQLLEFTQTHVHWVSDASNHLILCHPLLLLPSIFPSIRVFSKESVLRIRWPKYWSCIFSISLSNEHPGLISFRMDWLDLLAVQGTLRSLLQQHRSKALILQCSVFFIVYIHTRLLEKL